MSIHHEVTFAAAPSRVYEALVDSKKFESEFNAATFLKRRF